MREAAPALGTTRGRRPGADRATKGVVAINNIGRQLDALRIMTQQNEDNVIAIVHKKRYYNDTIPLMRAVLDGVLQSVLCSDLRMLVLQLDVFST